jgi:DNA-binding beta-propeller fold protein YncE
VIARVLRSTCVFPLLCFGWLWAQQPRANPPTVHTMLPTSKMLTLQPAPPGRIGGVDGSPMTMVVSPDGRYAALLNDGYGTQENLAHQGISVLDLKSNQVTDYPDSRFGTDAHQSLFLGLAFSSDGKHLYASVGSLTDVTGANAGDLGNGIAEYSFNDGKVAPERFIPIAPQPLAEGKRVPIGLKPPPHTAIPYPAGVAIINDHGHDKLLVANNLADNVLLLDTADGKVLKTFDLSTSHLVPSSYPYTCVATRDGKLAWCSLWNASEVAELNLTSGKVVQWIDLHKSQDPLAPGSHPTAMLLSPSEKTLYVALSNSDAVAVVGTKAGQPFGSLAMAPQFLNLRKGRQPGPLEGGAAYPTALAQSAHGDWLFVADSSLNAVSVTSVSAFSDGPPGGATGFEPTGYIPTDWYPSALAVHGNELLIATAKGPGTGPNPGMGKTNYEVEHHKHPYIVTLLKGSIARLDVSSTLAKLPELTNLVENDNLLHSDPGTMAFAGGKNPIKHVIYILKENRTYDQILGDMKEGNGDPSLTLYGEDVTPNEHKLARQFGVLDNFYDSGEVSGDGHQWSTAAITSDYNEKTWQIAYRGKERTYDFQGQVADEYPLDNQQPDIDDPATGFLWDNLTRNNVTFRDYGEFVNALWCNQPRRAANPKEGTPSGQEARCTQTEVEQGGELPPNVGDPHGSNSPWPWAVPLFHGTKPTKMNLRDHYDELYPDFNTDYPDQLRVDEFMNEFTAFVRARKENEEARFQLPQFVLLYLPDDHTGGTRPDHPRPAASVADNDLALGRVVEAVSHSPYWDDTAIMVLEDDAQDGGDHVDAHRSIAFVISKYSPGSADQPYVEHRFYTTVNMVHSLETLLGLPPMNINDAYAPLMIDMFSGPGNQPPYKADFRNRRNGLIYEINRKDAPGGKISSKMDFSRPDAAPAAQLNRVLWQDQKGNTPMPKPQHGVVPADGDD